MKTHADKTQGTKSQSVENEPSGRHNRGISNIQFQDNRPAALELTQQQKMINGSPQALQLKSFQALASDTSKHNIQLRGNKSGRSHTANWTGLPNNLNAHMTTAGLDAHGRPSGLHAYTNGALPGGAILLERVGSPNSVHQIWWTTAAATGDVCKWSTMFPANFTVGMVTTVLQAAQNGHGGWPRAVDCSKLVLPYGGQMSIGTSGNTRYPSLGITPQSQRANITFGGITYNVHNHN